jgi:hypothetical protein
MHQAPRHSRLLVWLAATGAVAVSLAVASVAQACPSCKYALANHDPAQGDVVRGFFWSILFMLSMPFAIVGGLGSYAWFLVRRAKRAQGLGLDAASPAEGAVLPSDPA